MKLDLPLPQRYQMLRKLQYSPYLKFSEAEQQYIQSLQGKTRSHVTKSGGGRSCVSGKLLKGLYYSGIKQ